MVACDCDCEHEHEHDYEQEENCVARSLFAYLGMVNVCIEYTGDLHCDAVHGPSHAKISTDAPADNRGKGESFSPTDLVATALGSCMSTILAMAAQEHGLDVKGMTVSVSKEMSKDAPRRIVGLPSEVHIPLPASTPQRKLLEDAALNCPVHKSLPAEIDRPTKFFWEG